MARRPGEVRCAYLLNSEFELPDTFSAHHTKAKVTDVDIYRFCCLQSCVRGTEKVFKVKYVADVKISKHSIGIFA